MRSGKQQKPILINDNYSTYKHSFDLLFKYIDVVNKNIWFPFYNEGVINSYNFSVNKGKRFIFRISVTSKQ